MNWDAIGALAEFLSSIVVLATLIYIAVQVREAKNMNQITTSFEMTNNIAGRIIENPQLSEVIAKINDKTGYHLPQVKAAMKEWGLTAQEAEIWARYWGTVWRGFQARFHAGSLDDQSLAVFLENPQAVFFVRGAQRTFSKEFQNEMQSVKPDLFESET